MSKRDAEIYREAAEGICADPDYFSSCEAVAAHLERGLFASQVKQYDYLFRPHESKEANPLYWGDDWGTDAKECRVLALCFMAAIAEFE